jgi:hypothetical protein
MMLICPFGRDFGKPAACELFQAGTNVLRIIGLIYLIGLLADSLTVGHTDGLLAAGLTGALLAFPSVTL